MEKDLETRIRILEDIEEIKQLKSKYVYSLDERDWDAVLDCFTEDAKIDYGVFGKYDGRKEMEEFFKVTLPPFATFTIHMTQDPIVEVDGDKAKGKWYMHSANTFTKDNQPVWGGVRYNDELVKEKGKWKINSSVTEIFYMTPFHEGWVKKQMVEWK
jgi:ketosteroid isomerase-like protein